MIDYIIRENNYKNIPVYHGTSFSFDKFKISSLSVNSDFGIGIYFTSSYEDAKMYAVDNPDVLSNIKEDTYDIHRDLFNEEGEKFKKEHPNENFIDYINMERKTVPSRYKRLLKEYNEFHGSSYKTFTNDTLLLLDGFEKARSKHMGKNKIIIHAEISFNNPVIVDTVEYKVGEWQSPVLKHLGTYISAEIFQKETKKLADFFMNRLDQRDYAEGKIDEKTRKEHFIDTIKKSLSKYGYCKNHLWDTGGTFSEFEYYLKVDKMYDANIVKIGVGDIPAKGEFLRMMIEDLGYDGIIIKDAPKRYDIIAKDKKPYIHYVVFDSKNIKITKIEDLSKSSQKKKDSFVIVSDSESLFITKK